MFSKTCEYAIRALVYIAQQTREGQKVSITNIAEGIDSPKYFIAKILQDLGRKGFVHSTKGPHGGFYLSEEDREQTLSDVVREIDGNKIFDQCALGLPQCSNEHPCPIHRHMRKIKDDLQELLDNSKVGDLVDGIDENLTFLRQK